MKKFIPYLIVILFLIIPLRVSAWIVPAPLTEGGIADFLEELAGKLYVIGLALALVVIVIGGIMYMTSGGSEEGVSKAKKIITRGLIGAVIVILAGVIVYTIANLIESAL